MANFLEIEKVKKKQQGVAEGKISEKQALVYAKKLASEMGYKKALEHALMMANMGRDASWLPVIRNLKNLKTQGVAEGNVGESLAKNLTLNHKNGSFASAVWQNSWEEPSIEYHNTLDDAIEWGSETSAWRNQEIGRAHV